MTCRTWCTQHVTFAAGDIDACFGPNVELAFGNTGVRSITTDLSQSRDGTDPATITIHIDDQPVAFLDKHRAAALAWALLSHIAQIDADPTMAGFYVSEAEQHAAAAAVRSTR